MANWDHDTLYFTLSRRGLEHTHKKTGKPIKNPYVYLYAGQNDEGNRNGEGLWRQHPLRHHKHPISCDEREGSSVGGIAKHRIAGVLAPGESEVESSAERPTNAGRHRRRSAQGAMKTNRY